MTTFNADVVGWNVKQLGTARPYQNQKATSTQHLTKKSSRKRGYSRLFKACFPCCKKRFVDSDSEDTLSHTAYIVTDGTLPTLTNCENVVTAHAENPPIPGAFINKIHRKAGFYQVNHRSLDVIPVEETTQKDQYFGSESKHLDVTTLKKLGLDNEGDADSAHGRSMAETDSDSASGKSSNSTVLSQLCNVIGAENENNRHLEESAHGAFFQEIQEIDTKNEKMDTYKTPNKINVRASKDTMLPYAEVTDSSLVRHVKQAVSRISSNTRSQSLSQDPQGTLSELIHTPHKRPYNRKYIEKLVVNDGLWRKTISRYPLPGMVYMQNDYCHPRYSEENERVETFKSSSDRQRKGYEINELARVGWYFNGRAIQTFCCGMEMPQSPRGEPLDVHRGLSPQCSFALSLRSSVEFAYAREVEQMEERVRGLEVAGAAAELGTPIQCTEDPTSASAYGFPSDAFEIGALDMFVGHQETRPGLQWESTEDYTMNFSIPVEDSSYREGLVTNRTPTAAEVWQPHTGVGGEEPDGQARPASFQQNSVTNTGRVFVREPGSQSSQGAVRLLRSLNENDNRRSPVNLEEQIDFLGGPLGDGDRPRHRQFAFPSVRIWTYEGWPRDHPLNSAALVDAGLFYAGYGDCVLCFSCGIGIRHWLPMDNPWIEHARWRPSCFYVRSIQGPEFVEAALELTRNNRRPSYEEVRLEANDRIRRNAEQGAGRDEVIPLPGDRERELNLLCKSCYTNEMCIVLMPCRHLALCTRCSGRVFACPICRVRIETTFRARYD